MCSNASGSGRSSRHRASCSSAQRRRGPCWVEWSGPQGLMRFSTQRGSFLCNKKGLWSITTSCWDSLSSELLSKSSGNAYRSLTGLRSSSRGSGHRRSDSAWKAASHSSRPSRPSSMCPARAVWRVWSWGCHTGTIQAHRLFHADKLIFWLLPLPCGLRKCWGCSFGPEICPSLPPTNAHTSVAVHYGLTLIVKILKSNWVHLDMETSSFWEKPACLLATDLFLFSLLNLCVLTFILCSVCRWIVSKSAVPTLLKHASWEGWSHWYLAVAVSVSLWGWRLFFLLFPLFFHPPYDRPILVWLQ